MYSPLLASVGLYIRDLLGVDESLIKLGRRNWVREEFDTGYIVIDALGPQQCTASLESYDGDTEVQSLSNLWRGTVTVDFYGSEAYNRAEALCALCRSQAAHDLRRVLGIDVHHPRAITDVGALVGQQYGDKTQLEFTVERCSSTDIDTRRIDTAQLELRNEEGIFYDG